MIRKCTENITEFSIYRSEAHFEPSSPCSLIRVLEKRGYDILKKEWNEKKSQGDPN
jgi:hypothetical protein